jgi:AraC-like DNA-binding protein
MDYRELRLAPPLDSRVECVWVARAAGPSPAFEGIVPDGCPELIVQLADPFAVAGAPAPVTQPRALLVGALSRPLGIRALGRVHTVGVRFRPGGLARFLRQPQHQLTDQAVPLGDLFGSAGRELAEKVGEAADPSRLAEVVSDFLRPRLSVPRPEGLAIDAVVREMIRSGGRATVDALAGAAGVSPRHLERVFRREVGLSPKRLARIVRLQDVMRRVARAPSRWVEVALDCGYADQAHLAREFRELAGATPTAWLGREGQDLARRFTAPERLDAFFSG